MSQPLLPDPPKRFSSYDSWIRLSDSALSCWQSLWIRRDRLLSNLDTTIAFHERQHSRLTAEYEEERRTYLAAYETFAAAKPGSRAERDSLRVMYEHLQAAAHIYDQLVDGRRKVERKFEAWMDLQGFDGRPKGRDANGKLSRRRRRMRQERQDALSGGLALESMVANTRNRLEEFNLRSSEQGAPGDAMVACGGIRIPH